MSAFPSAYLDDLVLDKILRNTNFTSPANLYLGLFTTNPTAAGTGTEVTGGSYARQAVTFGASSSGTISNNALISFTGLPTATIPYYGVYDALTSGNLIIYGALPATISANSGDEVKIASGDLDISLSGS